MRSRSATDGMASACREADSGARVADCLQESSGQWQCPAAEYRAAHHSDRPRRRCAEAVEIDVKDRVNLACTAEGHQTYRSAFARCAETHARTRARDCVQTMSSRPTLYLAKLCPPLPFPAQRSALSGRPSALLPPPRSQAVRRRRSARSDPGGCARRRPSFSRARPSRRAWWPWCWGS